MSVIHSIIKIIGMIVIILFVRDIRKSAMPEAEHEEKNKIPFVPSLTSWSIGQGLKDDALRIIGLSGNNFKPIPPDKTILKENLSEPSNDTSSYSYAE